MEGRKEKKKKDCTLQTAMSLLRVQKPLGWLHPSGHRGLGQHVSTRVRAAAVGARKGDNCLCWGRGRARDGDSQMPINTLDVSGGSPLGQGPAATNPGHVSLLVGEFDF